MAVYYGSVPAWVMEPVLLIMDRKVKTKSDAMLHLIVFDDYAEYFDAVQRISEEQYRKGEGKDNGKA